MACISGYQLDTIGDCLGTSGGSFTVYVSSTSGGGPTSPIDITIKWLSPYNDVIELGVGNKTYTVNHLATGYYSFYLQSTCEPVNDEELVTVYISSGNCAEVSSITHTTCGEDNGVFEVTANNIINDSTYSLYDDEGNLVQEVEFSQNLTQEFYGLSAGTYYATVSDGYGCTAKTQTCVVKSSTTIDFDFYVVNDTGCPIDGMGKIYVTGLTGTPPFTYLWSPNGQTTSYITGLKFYNGKKYSKRFTQNSWVGCINKDYWMGSI